VSEVGEESTTLVRRDLPKLVRENVTMVSSITDALRQRIMDGTLAPGSRVAEGWVSREMDVSRGPVREALRELENEGLVVVHAYRGAVVNEIPAEELRDVLIPMRLILERQACIRALPRMTDDDMLALADMVEQMRALARGGDPDALRAIVEVDVRFHEYVTERGDQYHTLHIWKSIQPRIRAGFLHLAPRHPDLMNIADEHAELLDALRTRDPQVALDALELHISTTQLDLLARRPEASMIASKAIVT